MTIRLTESILIAGADTPIGTEITLNAALEGDLVNGNKAVYVRGAPVGGLVPVLAQPDGNRNIGIAGPGVSRANTIVLMGDSYNANNFAPDSSSYRNLQPYPWTLGNALADNRMKLIKSIASAGTTTVSHIANQLTQMASYPSKYVWYSGGTNDLFIDGTAGNVVAANVISIVESILAMGRIPIFQTVPARTGTASYYDDAIWCNDILRQYAKANNVGIFLDWYYLTQNPGSSTFGIRSGWKVDNALHPNNIESYWLGKQFAKALDAAGVPKCNGFSYGPEDFTLSVNNKSNLLVNPVFSGTGGTVSANCAGTMPTGWTIAWGTRGGTGVATASIVDVLDPVTGLACAKGISVAITAGTPNANDYIKITQDTGFATAIPALNYFSAQGVIDYASTANAIVYARAQTNTGSSWWGITVTPSGGGVNGAYPENARFAFETQALQQGALASTAGVWETWIAYQGASSGAVVVSQPRFRSSLTEL